MKIAIFASGSGTNAENIIRYFSKKPQFQIALVLSNKPSAYALQRAKNLHIPSCICTKSDFQNTENILDILNEYEIEFIVLAGFLLKVPKYLLKKFDSRIINIHPALLPKYGGKGMYGDKVHEAVVAAGDTESGITIHYINEHYDEGNIIFQATCPILPKDTPHDVATKVHALEYKYFPVVIEDVLQRIISNT